MDSKIIVKKHSTQSRIGWSGYDFYAVSGDQRAWVAFATKQSDGTYTMLALENQFADEGFAQSLSVPGGLTAAEAKQLGHIIVGAFLAAPSPKATYTPVRLGA